MSQPAAPAPVPEEGKTWEQIEAEAEAWWRTRRGEYTEENPLGTREITQMISHWIAEHYPGWHAFMVARSHPDPRNSFPSDYVQRSAAIIGVVRAPPPVWDDELEVCRQALFYFGTADQVDTIDPEGYRSYVIARIPRHVLLTLLGTEFEWKRYNILRDSMRNSLREPIRAYLALEQSNATAVWAYRQGTQLAALIGSFLSRFISPAAPVPQRPLIAAPPPPPPQAGKRRHGGDQPTSKRQRDDGDA